MQRLLSSISCNLDSNILSACLPLFENAQVDAIEWSFDALYNHKEIPDWFTELVQHFGNEGRLVGHGVFFSIFSGKWLPEQEKWLSHLEKVSQKFKLDHITEHFGFMTGEDFHHGAPLSIPYSSTTLRIGQDRLKRIYNACKCPVGLENLAFAYSSDDVKKHGQFLSELIEPINGFIILDLHNIYCQLHNFDVQFEDLIKLYPLDKVREIHISGGSWDDSHVSPKKKIRRDTHDDAVPDEVFQLLKEAIPMCPNLKFVVVEQIGFSLNTQDKQELLRKDFLKMKTIVDSTNDTAQIQNSFLPDKQVDIKEPITDIHLHQQQMDLSRILETSANYETAKSRLLKSSLANTEWEIEQWTPYMLETALKIAQKWK